MAVAFLSDFHQDNNVLDEKDDSDKPLFSLDHHKLRLCFKAFVKW